MGDGQLPTIKYHYFDGRFVYWVKRSGRFLVVLVLKRVGAVLVVAVSRFGGALSDPAPEIIP